MYIHTHYMCVHIYIYREREIYEGLDQMACHALNERRRQSQSQRLTQATITFT